MPPWQPEQLKPPLAVVWNSSSPQPTNSSCLLVDGAGLTAGLEDPVERQADDQRDQQQHTEELHALEATALEDLVVVVRLPVRRHLDLGAELLARGGVVQEVVRDPADQ